MSFWAIEGPKRKCRILVLVIWALGILMIERQTAEFRKLVDALVKAGALPDTETLARVAEALANIFVVNADEVAIFVTDPTSKNLRFVIPEKLAPVGWIPLRSGTALVARTARERRAEFVNNFGAMPHASVFEGVPLGRHQGEPIQKIMSAPILEGTRACGVVQISRKGRTASEAGADFTQMDLHTLKLLAPTLEHFLKLCNTGGSN
jgi:GAF domain